MTTADEKKLTKFSKFEFECIFGACAGFANKEIAQYHGVDEHAVKHMLSNVYDKAGVSPNRSELVSWVKAALSGELRRRRARELKAMSHVRPKQT